MPQMHVFHLNIVNFHDFVANHEEADINQEEAKCQALEFLGPLFKARVSKK